MIAKKNSFSAFDYSEVQRIPEITLRVELLRERLLRLSKDPHGRILEVGIGSGDVTLMLAQDFEEVTCIESDDENCNLVLGRLREQNLCNVQVIRSRVEDTQLPVGNYEHIILLGVLEHLEDPVKVLYHLVQSLHPNGYLHISVNLANSLHRWLGVAMGKISHVEELAESDILLGHHRVYNPSMLRKHVESAGLQVTYEKSFYLKPLPTSMLSSLPMDIHKALDLLGQKFPEFASYMYVEVAH